MADSSTGFSHPIHQQVAKAVRARRLLQTGHTVLVAVSGGPDSVALLSILRDLAPSWNLSLTVVHCHYGLRGAESDGDAAFVTALCRRWNIPCLVRPLSLVRRGTGASSSLQARARDSRYRLFRRLASALGAERVALGHTADDQAETVLLRMLRGAGVRGLAGMPHMREGLFVRPLLAIARQDVLSYLEAMRLSYRLDSSNATPIYLRNRIRQELLPAMRSLAPAVIRILARQADLLRDDDLVLDALAKYRLEKIVLAHNRTTMVLDRVSLFKQPPALQRRMIRQAVHALSPFTVPRSDLLRSLAESLVAPRSGKTWTVGTVTITYEQDRLRLTTASSLCGSAEMADGSEAAVSRPPCDGLTISSLPWTAPWPLTGELIHLQRVARGKGTALLARTSSTVALFDAEQLSLPLQIRSWRPGDWFCPAGMEGRRKKLQDYFTDAKLSRSVRARMPLLLSRDAIAWIVGQRVDERFAATDTTRRFILARVTQPPHRKGVL
jgi:tRNA(Ile)-lysidine synthase